MFFHNFKYSFKILMKDKALIFWTFAFPIILGTFFSMAFSDIEKNEKLEVFPIAIVENDNSDSTYLKEAFNALSEGEDRLFEKKELTEEEAKKELEAKSIEGYVILSKTPTVVIRENGIQETILKTVTETILEEIDLVSTTIEEKIKQELKTGYYINLEAKIEQIKESVLQEMENVEDNIVDSSPKNLSYTMIEFYTLIAMTCLYGGILSMVNINKTLANMSSYGKRVSVSSTKKSHLILSSLLASFLAELIGLILLFLYTILILKVDYGTHLFGIFLLSIIGTIAGLTLGCAIGILVKQSENTKTGILLAITMTGCFFSGMMGITMKYVIDKNIPFLNQINPANMITDGFYSLYYYETNTRFFQNVVHLLLFSGILFCISFYGLRRQKYDSI